MREVYRIRKARYTDSDVVSFYMKYRERGIGPFIREVGDFIAHERRDRGLTLEATAFTFSQLAFFQTYQSDKSVSLDPFGSCGWWLKTYLLGKLKESSAGDILKETGLSKKAARAEIESWFPSREPYPTTIECRNLSAFFGLTSLFGRYIRGTSVFTTEGVKKELLEAFKLEDIERKELPHFLVATAVILAGRSCEIVPGFKVNISVAVDQPRHLQLDDIPTPEGATWKYVRLLPDGNLKVSVATQNNTGDGLVGVGLEFLNTGVDTETYVDRRLITVDQHGHRQLNLDRPLAFERASIPMVFPID